jgi:plastocyanin
MTARCDVRRAVTVVLLVGVLIGCTPTPDARTALPADVGDVMVDLEAIMVRDNVYVPDVAVVAVGTTVRWVWDGRAAHDVVGDGFTSRLIVTGEFTHTFTETGAYQYVCTLHPGMVAVIHVREP